jgi:hypothetical protein
MASQLGHSKGNPDDRQKKSKDEIEIKKTSQPITYLAQV